MKAALSLAKRLPPRARCLLAPAREGRENNRKRQKHKGDAPRSLGHAEISAISDGAKEIGSWRLNDCTLYVTLEPLPHVRRSDYKRKGGPGGLRSRRRQGGERRKPHKPFSPWGYNHAPALTVGVLEDDCSRLLSEFFRKAAVRPWPRF